MTTQGGVDGDGDGLPLTCRLFLQSTGGESVHFQDQDCGRVPFQHQPFRSDI